METANEYEEASSEDKELTMTSFLGNWDDCFSVDSD